MHRLSLRGRLLLAVGAVALVALVVADVVIYSALRSFLYDRVDQALESTRKPIELALASDREHGPTTVAAIAPETYVEIRDRTDRVLVQNPARRRGEPPSTPQLPDRIEGPGDGGLDSDAKLYLTTDAAEDGGPPFRVRVSDLPGGRQLILGLPLDDTLATLRRLVVIELAVTAAGLLAGLAVGFWLVRVGLRPLAEVEETADAIADGQLTRRVPGAGARTEVGRLARALNTMLGRIEDAFGARDATEAELRRSEERLRRFVADASHELRTPLTAVSAYAELFERGASDRPADLARVMSGIRVETARMGELVEDLLLLARLDEGRPLERDRVELVGLAVEAIDAARAVGPEWPVQLEAERPVEVEGDPSRIRQILDNLLANVRAHTPAGTPARLRVAQVDSAALIEVADQGPGLTADEAGRVFERFYRADPSRSRRHGGAGLGLAIVAAIAGAHGGRVATSETPGGGATFDVWLPVTATADDGDGDGD